MSGVRPGGGFARGRSIGSFVAVPPTELDQIQLIRLAPATTTGRRSAIQFHVNDLPTRFDDLDHETYVRDSLTLAREAAERGDEPYGSLLVRAGDGAVVMKERNAENTADDVRRHPELTLAHRAAREFSPDQRADLIMYTSTEPCPMCAGGIAHVELGAVVHSTSAERAAELYGRDSYLPSEEVYERLGSSVAVGGPVLPEAGDAVHREIGGAVPK